jgi:hypothetical protein
MRTISELRKFIAAKQAANVASTFADRDLYLDLIDELAQHIAGLQATAPSDPLADPAEPAAAAPPDEPPAA